jgi:hypothetical protein
VKTLLFLFDKFFKVWDLPYLKNNLQNFSGDYLDEEPEGSQSLAANSPEHEDIESTSENGESDVQY